MSGDRVIRIATSAVVCAVAAFAAVVSYSHIYGLDDLFQGFDQAFVPSVFRYALNGVEPNVEPGLRKRRSARSRYRCRPDR